MRSRHHLPIIIAATAACLLAGANNIAPAFASTSPSNSLATVPISHVIEVMLENHTFDSLFAYFPRANGIPATATLVDPAQPMRRVAPFTAPANEGDVQGGLNNSRSAEIKMMDRQPSYKMDGYTVFPGEGLSSITTFDPVADPNLQYLARHFALADRNFQPAIAPTLPNVLYALAATSHGQLTNTVPAGGPPWFTIFDELTKAHRSWHIYSGVPTSVYQGTVWTRLLPPGTANDLTSASQFFSDLKHGNLPNFSFVRPGVGYSEEPPEDVSEGDAWLGQLVNAVAHSRYWRSTAIFLTYDEGGGFFDHVSPPVVADSFGYGTRTPLVIVSPWVKRGVFRSTTTNISILSFIQQLFNLPPLSALNAKQNNLTTAFNFQQRALPVPIVPNAPPETIGFYGSNILANVAATGPGQPLAINLQVNTDGLALDSRSSGQVVLTLIPPAGTPIPPGFPTSVGLTNGMAHLTLSLPNSGYYRVEATGPGNSLGWLTLDVGVNAMTR